MGSTVEEAKRKTNLPLGVRQIASIRCLAADIVEKAGSGHPGAPMGMAAMAHVLWGETMKYSPKNPQWMARDRFVMSNGHSCALQYIMLYLTGYDSVGLQDLRKLRQFESYTPGHPERHATEGIEVSTGPLGQGISNAVGLAIAESHLAAVYNKPGFELFDNYTFVLTGDGCMQEGVASEACSLAGHLGQHTANISILSKYQYYLNTYILIYLAGHLGQHTTNISILLKCIYIILYICT